MIIKQSGGTDWGSLVGISKSVKMELDSVNCINIKSSCAFLLPGQDNQHGDSI